MKMVIFYFSGTGNTWWVARQLKNELVETDNKVEVFSIENPLVNEEKINGLVKENDCIIIGYPTYGSDLPKNMREFIKNLPAINDNKKFAVFCTHAGFTGDGNVYFRKTIEDKGYKFLQSIQFTMTTNFNVAMFPFSFSKPAEGKKLDKKKNKTLKKIKKFVQALNDGKEWIEGKRFYHLLFGGIQRHFFRKGEDKFADDFKFLKEKCLNCNLCIKECPVSNWFFDKEGELKSKGKCILCFRCYNFCPGHAINFGKKVKYPEKYRRYKGPEKDLKISDIRK